MSVHWQSLALPRGLWPALVGELAIEKPKCRQNDLDVARGMAIVLVVVGHLVAREMPAGNAWYGELKRLIYLFHMPLFMALAGMSFAISTPRFRSWQNVGQFSSQRVERLLTPYLFVGLLVLVGKLIAAHFLHVDNPPSGSLRDVWLLFAIPGESVAGFLWFAFVLIVYFAILPACFHAVGRYPAALLGIALVLSVFEWTSILMLDRVFEYLPFFALGMLAWATRRWWLHISLLTACVWVGALALTLALSFVLPVPKWFAGAISVPATLALAQHMSYVSPRTFQLLGQSSLAIYLLNTIAIGVTKGLLLKLLPWDGVNFFIYFPVLLCSGLAIPVAVRQLLPRLWPRSGRYL